MKNGKHLQSKKDIDYSKKTIEDTRALLWIISISGLILAFVCVWRGFTASLPWISSLVGLPWAAHGTICSFYLNMAKSDHSEGGITFETAKANDFQVIVEDDDINSKPI